VVEGSPVRELLMRLEFMQEACDQHGGLQYVATYAVTGNTDVCKRPLGIVCENCWQYGEYILCQHGSTESRESRVLRVCEQLLGMTLPRVPGGDTVGVLENAFLFWDVARDRCSNEWEVGRLWVALRLPECKAIMREVCRPGQYMIGAHMIGWSDIGVRETVQQAEIQNVWGPGDIVSVFCIDEEEWPDHLVTRGLMCQECWTAGNFRADGCCERVRRL
jgi:hypothetical protein